MFVLADDFGTERVFHENTPSCQNQSEIVNLERNIVMDKYIEIFCKQNPKFSVPCGNPDCKKEHTSKSKDVFKEKIYEFKCESCDKTTEIDTTKFVKDFVSQLKKLGITAK